MAIKITIQNQVIEFPESSENPNWAPALVEFAQAVEQAIGTISGTFDVAPQTINIDSQNPGTVEIKNLDFPPSDVVKADILYSVFRETDSVLVTEGGKLTVSYDESRPATQKWDIAQVRQGDGFVDFTISDIGRIQAEIKELPALLSHTGFISFRAVALLNK
jgi:hypothetical protein